MRGFIYMRHVNGCFLKKLFTYADEYVSQSDWKDTEW